MSLEEGDLLARAREALDRSVDDLDPATLGRLRAARREALAGSAARRRKANAWRTPLGALAVAALAAVVGISWWTAGGAEAPAAPPAIEDLDVVASSDDLELYEELEFYEWLEASHAKS